MERLWASDGRNGIGEELSDAHTHMGTVKERQEREEAGIVSLVCLSTPEEAREAFSGKWTYLIPTCGVHPWHAHRQEVESLLEWMEQCPVIGEIGMDSVWCQVPLHTQRQVFEKQLALAGVWRKPVILHTKGREQAIARIIRTYPNRYLVHWYSCQEHLEDYLDLDCYFSIGPDVWWNEVVAQVVKKVPRHRLLVETDGLDSVRWAFEEGRRVLGKRGKDSLTAADPDGHLPPWDESAEEFWKNAGVLEALTVTVEWAAKILGLAAGEAGAMFKENLVNGFLGGKV